MTSQGNLSPKQQELLRELEKTGGKTKPSPQPLPPIPDPGAEPETYQRAIVQWLNALHLQQEQLLEHAASMRSMLQFFVVLVVLSLLFQGCQVLMSLL